MLIPVPEKLKGKYHWCGTDGEPYLDNPHTIEQEELFHEFLELVDRLRAEEFNFEE
ncbi:MAG: hypothetical protein RR590_07020 [Hungatella sp.]